MKKFWTILAVAALFVACGGNDKKDEKSAEGEQQKTEQTEEQKQDNGEKKVDVEAKAVEYATKLMNATSEEEATQIAEEADKWFDSLSEEEAKRATEAMLMM